MTLTPETPGWWTQAAAVAGGASLGALLRWQLGLWLNGLTPHWPWGTLAANLLGGLGIGIAVTLLAAAPGASPLWRLLLVTGFLGGFTTFSAFSAEVVAAAQAGRLGLAALLAFTHVAGSLLATVAGMALARSLLGASAG